ncbi:MAG TPA: hypothetical protein VF788_03525 [Pseudonocardiaceae bacterium]|jgi:hypothetical protein
MARLIVEGSDLIVWMNPLEILGALRGPVRVPLASIMDLAASISLWSELRGLRMPGTGLPGVIALGTWRYRDGKDFAAVYASLGVIVTLTGAPWSRLLVSSRDPAGVRREINTHR